MLKSLSAKGVRFNVFDEGAGMPILFVHGFPLSHLMWAEQVQPLAVRYRVIAPDLRGFGGSQVLPGFWLKVEWLWQDPLPKLLGILREWGLI